MSRAYGLRLTRRHTPPSTPEITAMLRSARAPIHLDATDLAPPEQKLEFLREARTALRTGLLPCGCPLPADRRDLLVAYVDHLAQAVRPRLVDEMAVTF